MDKHNDIEFDLIELLLYIKKKFLVVLLVVAIFAGLGFTSTKFLMTPTYTADARIHVFREEEDALDISSMQVVTALRRDVAVLITGKNVSKQVVAELGLNMNPNYLSSKLAVQSEDSTRILEVSYEDTDPQRAAIILNKVCDVTKAQIAELMGEDVLKVVYYADVPTSPSSASPTSNAILFGIVGLVLVLLVLIVVFLMDDTIRSEEDVERYLGLSTLSSIPISQEFSTLKKVEDKRSITGRLQHKKR